MRIIRYLKTSKLAVIAIALLLIVQAFTDLSLPRYTSDLVDVGIQQKGIEHPSPEIISKESFDALCSSTSAEQASIIYASYQENSDGTLSLKSLSVKDREDLDKTIAAPFSKLYFGGSTQEDNVSESLTEQQAIAAVQLEYETLGLDTASIQMNYLIITGLQMLGITALMVVVSVLVGLLASRTAAKIAADLREKLFDRVVHFSDAEVQSFSAASLITRGTNDIQQIQFVIVMLLRMVLYSPILAIGGIIMVSQTNIAMSWIVVLAVVVLAIVIAVLMALALPKFKIMQQLIDRVNLVSREMLSGLQVVRAFGRQVFEEKRFDEASTSLFKTQLFTNRTMAFMMPAMMLIMNASSVLIVWVGGGYINEGIIQTGDMIAFITYAMVIVMSFLMIGMIAIMLPRADVAASRVNEVLNTQSSIKDPPAEKTLHLSTHDESPEHPMDVVFDKVFFSYDAKSEAVLRDISFTAQQGKTTALIGATGSGKTTILKLIERFYDVDSGSVLVGGIDVRCLKQHELRKHLAYVPQKAFLFSGSVEQSIAYGLPENTTDNTTDGTADSTAADTVDSTTHNTSRAYNKAVEQAAQTAQASKFIALLENGFETELSQGGTNVSGGQRQRLSIARALATNAPILLFDDSFSALDYTTDANLRTALKEHAADKTIIIVAQRISTVLHADTIIVLEEGRIVGQGTHEELLRNCSTYYEIAQSQLPEEELEGGVINER